MTREVGHHQIIYISNINTRDRGLYDGREERRPSLRVGAPLQKVKWTSMQRKMCSFWQSPYGSGWHWRPHCSGGWGLFPAPLSTILCVRCGWGVHHPRLPSATGTAPQRLLSPGPSHSYVDSAWHPTPCGPPFGPGGEAHLHAHHIRGPLSVVAGSRPRPHFVDLAGSIHRALHNRSSAMSQWSS